jgi:hypothetical protein
MELTWYHSRHFPFPFVKRYEAIPQFPSSCCFDDIHLLSV